MLSDCPYSVGACFVCSVLILPTRFCLEPAFGPLDREHGVYEIRAVHIRMCLHRRRDKVEDLQSLMLPVVVEMCVC